MVPVPVSPINVREPRSGDGWRTVRRVAHRLGYARVSTAEQDPALQHDALTAAGCWKTWTDTASGRADDRPELAACLAALRPGDTLVVWRLDRLGRSLRHLIDTMTDLDTRQVGFRSLTEAIDTTTAGGRLVFHLFAALADFERELIRDRTLAGLAAARARGRMGGRPTVMTPDRVAAARKMLTDPTLTMAQIAEVLGVSRTALYRGIRQPAAPPVEQAPTKTAAAKPAKTTSTRKGKR